MNQENTEATSAESPEDEVRNGTEEPPVRKSVARRSDSSKTPFDYPLVSPIFLFVLAAWFGYDGWFNPETKSIMFNRIVFGFLLVGALWTLSVDLRIMRREREKKEAAEQAAKSAPADDPAADS